MCKLSETEGLLEAENRTNYAPQELSKTEPGKKMGAENGTKIAVEEEKKTEGETNFAFEEEREKEGEKMGAEKGTNSEVEELMKTEGKTNFAFEEERKTEGEKTGAEGWMNYALEKLRETKSRAEVEEWIKYVVAKGDEYFPPETRAEQIKHLFQIAKPIIINILIGMAASSVIGLAGGLIGGLAGRVMGMMGSSASAGKVKMMVAPGTGGAVKIARAAFEASPKLYFRALRGNI